MVELWAAVAVIVGVLMVAVVVCLSAADRAQEAARRAEEGVVMTEAGPSAARLAKLIAFAAGDIRGVPERCGFCQGAQLDYRYERDVWFCTDCGCETTGEIVYRNRLGEAARELGVLDQAAARAIAEEWLA